MQEMRKTGRGRSQRGREREIIFTLTGAKFQGRLPREAEAGPGLPIKGPKGWVTGRNTMKWGGEEPLDGSRFGSWPYDLLAMSPWVTCLTPACFSFLICKNRISTYFIGFL